MGGTYKLVTYIFDTPPENHAQEGRDRKTRVRNFVAGRWALTVKKDKDGNFQKCKVFKINRRTPSKQIAQQLLVQVSNVQRS